MPLTIKKAENNKITFQYENIISLWNIMKYLMEAPYLKKFVVEKYEGGNMLVPREAWKEEGVLFKEIKPGVYFFPYESAGFVIDDSIHNLKLYIGDHLSENSNFRDTAEMTFTVQDTDTAILTTESKNAPLFTALYLLSVSKLGFDNVFLNALVQVTEDLLTSAHGMEVLEYLSTSVLVGLKKLSFIIRTFSRNGEEAFYRITYAGRKCKKEQLKEKNIRNISYLKKKILKRNKYYPTAFYSAIALIAFVLFIANKKVFFIILIGGLVLWLLYFFIRKNAYKFISRQ